MTIDVETVYRKYGPMVLRRCRVLLKDEAAAVDVMHDVFVQLLRHRERLVEAGTSSLLYRIATHACLNRLRSASRQAGDADEALLLRIAGLEDLEARTGAASVLARLFGREPESSRTMAVLHLVDGLTLEETADAVGLSVSGVRKRLRTLRARLEAQEGTDS